MPVAHGERPVKITYNTPGGAPITESFDFLIVACDPRALKISDCTDFEKEVKDRLTSFTFHTSLFKAKRPSRPSIDPANPPQRHDKPNYVVRFHPGVLQSADGHLYGFRDEVMAHTDGIQPDPSGSTWLTTYQLDATPLIGKDANAVLTELDQKRDSVIATNTTPENFWLDWEPDHSEKPQPEESVLVDYFPHFLEAGLKDNLPWKILDIQGDNNTLYVSSFTCFESVLHCFLYEGQLMHPDGPVVKDKFPKDKNARIAICGAGPSGILFASQHLCKNGYENFSIFEPTDRFGGKTQTKRRTAPSDKDKRIPCELGTCYLSPGYAPMYDLFEEYDAGKIIALDNDPNFRSIIDLELAKGDIAEMEDGVEFGKWVAEKNGPDLEAENFKIAVATVKYILVHYAVMGMDSLDALPAEPPSELNIIKNLRSLFEAAKAKIGMGDVSMDDDMDLEAKDLYNAFAEKQDEEKSAPRALPRGIFDVVDGLRRLLGVIDFTKHSAKLRLSSLVTDCKDVMGTTFAAYLDSHGMGSLKTVFTYGYEVQGYGTITAIPTYYGMVWLTPAVLQYNIISRLIPPTGEAAERGVVNIVSDGWLTLWEQMVKKDGLGDKIIYKANITDVTRH